MPAQKPQVIIWFLNKIYWKKYAYEVRTFLKWKLKIFYRLFCSLHLYNAPFISVIKIPCTKHGIFNLNTPQIWEKLIVSTSRSGIYKVNITKRITDPRQFFKENLDIMKWVLCLTQLTSSTNATSLHCGLMDTATFSIFYSGLLISSWRFQWKPTGLTSQKTLLKYKCYSLNSMY